MADGLELFSARLADGQVDSLLATYSAGTEGFGQLFHATTTKDARMRVTPVTDVLEKVQFQVLRPDLILATHRAGWDEGAAWACNACLPSNDQILIRRRNDSFQVSGRRTFPEPYMAVNRFLGAVKRGDVDGASRYVASRPMIRLAQELRLYEWSAIPSQGDHVRQAEQFNWALIPGEFRHMVVPRALTFILTKGQEQVALSMERRPGRWVITSIRRLPPVKEQ